MKETPSFQPQNQDESGHIPTSAEAHLDTFFHSPSFHDGVSNLVENSPISAEDLLEMCAGDERLMKVYENLVRSAIRYVETILELDYEARNNTSYDPETVSRKDQERRFAHNAFIDATNMMSRELARADKDNTFFATVITRLPDGTYSRPPYTLFAMQFAMSYYLMKHPELT